MAMNCNVCGTPTTRHWSRCEDHYRCDDCGTREKLCTHIEGVLCDPCHKKRVEKRVSDFAGETQYTSEIVCPHCGYTVSDSWERGEGEMECDDCGRKFEFSRYVETTYSTSKR